MSDTRTWRISAAAGGIGLAVLVVLGAQAPAQAAEQRYSTWPDPSRDGAGRVQELIDALRAMVDEAERARAADPRLLRDLRDLARRFERPWRTSVLADDFADGDFTANPAWTVTAGRYWVEPGYGLRSAVTPAAAAPGGGGERQKEDLAAAIIGSILNQALGQKSGQQRAAAPARAAIHVAGTFTNAFSIRLDITSWQGKGHLEIGPYQGAARRGGYRLAYRPGSSPALELLRVSERGTSVINSVAGPLVLEDQRTHVIEWTRDAFGAMTVSVDEKEVMRATDRGISGPFDGFAMVNRGGDYVLRRIAIRGTR